MVREVFKVPQARIQQRPVPSRPSTSLLVEVSKVFSQDRVRGLRTRSMTFLLVDAFTDFSLILALQAHPQIRVTCVGKGFFALFPFKKKKCEAHRAGGRGAGGGGQPMDAGCS